MQLIAQFEALNQQTFDDNVRNAVDTAETVTEENNKSSELVTEATTKIDSSEQQTIFIENHLNINAESEHLYKEGALGDYKSNPMLNFGPTSVADKTGNNHDRGYSDRRMPPFHNRAHSRKYAPDPAIY